MKIQLWLFVVIAYFGVLPDAVIARSLSYRRTAEDLADYQRRIDSDLRENILPYWLQHSRDLQRGGFFGEVSDTSGVARDAPRGALLTARVLWTFSAAFERYKDPAYLDMARWAYEDLMSRFWDQEHGGLYWSVSADGVPLDPRKIIYVQSFGIYALAEFHRATGERPPLDRAIELYRTVEQHSRDDVNRGYFEEFSRDWKKSTARGVGGSAMGSLGQKSQNVHLHILEAYTNLLKVWPDEQLKRGLSDLVDLMLVKVMDPKTYHLRLFLNEDWSYTSDVISYGHDIEFSWLVVEAAEVIGNEALTKRVKADALKIAAVTLEEGIDTDGAVLAEGDPNGVINRSKDWWPQAEGTVGFLNAYQLSGDASYLQASLKNWDFIENNLIDRRKGEWFVGVSDTGKVASRVKISFWKCPYHNGRACMEMLTRLKTVGASLGR